MRHKVRLSLSLQIAVCAAAFLVVVSAVRSQISAQTDVNVSKMGGNQSECAIAVNPTNKLQVFVLCNNDASTGLFAARSADGGLTWAYPGPGPNKLIADGTTVHGPAACCDPSLAWDTFGNLYLTYLSQNADAIVTLLSTDGGVTFTLLAYFDYSHPPEPPCIGCVDRPIVVAANTTVIGAPVAVWIVWHEGYIGGTLKASGAAVTAAGVGAFGAPLTIPGTTSCSFGDIAIAPDGTVVQVCEITNAGEGQSAILFNAKADGLGPGNFAAAVTATMTNVGGKDFIPAQKARGVDAVPGLAYDSRPQSPHFGRLYLVYTEETVDESNDTDILLRFSDDNGGTWSPPITVSDDSSGRSQFLPRIAINADSGNIAICWYDCRNSMANTAVEVFCAIANRDFFPTFIGPNVKISDGASTSSGPPLQPFDFGDYSGLAYFKGLVHPVWADKSNTVTFEAYTDRVTGGPAAMEGEPHITTVDGVHYDFQGAGEFVALRDVDGLEIQTRQIPVATSFNPGPNPYTGLATCVSFNTAVAARVGKHRVTFQPNLSGIPDPSGLQLRVDGVLTTLSASGLDLGTGSRLIKSIGDGIEIDFPDGTMLIVTPSWWADQSKWYLNVNVFHTPAQAGIMGAIPPGSWLPELPDGTSMGPMPAALHDRYVAFYQKFGDAWRVTDKTSLFDYAAGTSTETFTMRNWPPENPPCVIPDSRPVKPLDPSIAQEICRPIAGENRNADCVFDVTVTGERGFAKTYLLSQRIELGLTTTTVHDDKDPSKVTEPVTFTAVVRHMAVSGRGIPSGTVQFTLDGSKVGGPATLDSNGRASWKVSNLKSGNHKVTASYIPSANSVFLPSSSFDEVHTVSSAGHWPWWYWFLAALLVLIILLLAFVWWLRRT